MNTALMEEWLALDQRKRALKAELETLEAALKTVEQSVLQEMANAGQPNWESGTGRTVYIYSERRPQLLADREAMVAALKASGRGYMVKEDFNLNTLRSEMLEWIENRKRSLSKQEAAVMAPNDAIPEEFRGLMEVGEKFSIRSCASKKRSFDLNSLKKGNEEDEPI